MGRARKRVREIFVLFLTPAYESTIISIKSELKKKKAHILTYNNEHAEYLRQRGNLKRNKRKKRKITSKETAA